MGIIGLTEVAKKAAPVVPDVVRVARAALLQAIASFFLSSLAVNLFVAA